MYTYAYIYSTVIQSTHSISHTHSEENGSDHSKYGHGQYIEEKDDAKRLDGGQQSREHVLWQHNKQSMLFNAPQTCHVHACIVMY